MPPSDAESLLPYASPRLVRYGSILELTHADFLANGPIDNAVVCKGNVFCKFFFKSA
jgi:hypothetical protein